MSRDSGEWSVVSGDLEPETRNPKPETAGGETALLEIGVGDIPASYFPEPLEQLKRDCESGLSAAGLSSERVEVLATPRRLAVLVRGVSERATAGQREVKGPPAAAAFDDQGKPTPAAIGFAKAQGVEVESLVRKSSEKGEYVFAVFRDEGKPAADVLGAVWTWAIRSLSFPKTMRWKGTFRFVRPIRWLVGMVGSRPVEFAFEGLTAGRTTHGHRFVCPGAVAIDDAGEYVEVLRKAGVMVDQEERRNAIKAQGEQLASSAGGVLHAPDGLLEEVTFMCERPTLFLGNFDPEFLNLPEAVLETIMRKHQRYFAIGDSGGRLLPHFVAVRDGDERNLDEIRRANERVLRARLKDGVFFYGQDMRRRLEDRVPELEKITFQEGLGTMRDKAERLSYVVRRIGELAKLEDATKDTCGRAAWLCKADLLTEMVKELPELQGTVGGAYAREQKESEAVAKAVEEHYLPQSSDDPIPSTIEGQILSVADKVDTLCACLSVGLAPTGSEDPYGLRRAAQGAVRILLERGISPNVRLSALVNVAGQALSESGIAHPRVDESRQEAYSLLVDRVGQSLLDRGLPRDVVNAAMGPDPDAQHPRRILERALAIGNLLRGDERMPPLAIAATRVSNILNSKQAREDAAKCEGGPDEGLFQEEAEQNLYRTYKAVEEAVCRLQEPVDYPRLLDELTPLVEPISKFFDGVLVMTEDETLRNNRLALLRQVQAVFARFGDLSRLEMDGGTGKWLGGGR